MTEAWTLEADDSQLSTAFMFLRRKSWKRKLHEYTFCKLFGHIYWTKGDVHVICRVCYKVEPKMSLGTLREIMKFVEFEMEVEKRRQDELSKKN